jgi:hypothetical protein
LQKVRQPRDIHRNPSSLIFGEQFRRLGGRDVRFVPKPEQVPCSNILFDQPLGDSIAAFSN